MPLVCKSPDGVIVSRFSKLKERLGKGRSDNCIFVPTYSFQMFPEKRESFAPKHFGNMPSERPSLILRALEIFSRGSNFIISPCLPGLLCKTN